MIRTSFSTLGCPDWSWQALLEYGPQFGYDGVEIRLLEGETNLLARSEFQSSELPARRRELDASGFQVCGLASSVRFDSPDADERAEQVEIGKAYLDLAAELGTSFVRVFGDVLPAGSDDHQRKQTIGHIAEGLQRLGEYAQQAGPLVVIETHGDFSDSAAMRETLSLVESPQVGVLWDTHHPWRFYGEELSTTFRRLERWIRHTHWKDSVTRPARPENEQSDEAAAEAARQAHALMSGHRHADYVLFGGGEFPVLECMRLLKQSGYDGWFSYEWEKMWHPEIEEPEIALPLFPGKFHELWELLTPSSD